jgi:hypothetical protein
MTFGKVLVDRGYHVTTFLPTQKLVCVCVGGGVSSFGTATGYGREGLEIESQPPIKWVPVLFAEGKAAGVWRYHPHASSTEVKEIVELHSPSWLSWSLLG